MGHDSTEHMVRLNFYLNLALVRPVLVLYRSVLRSVLPYGTVRVGTDYGTAEVSTVRCRCRLPIFRRVKIKVSLNLSYLLAKAASEVACESLSESTEVYSS